MNGSLPRFVIIPAAGSGSRMGNQLPKQFLLLNGMPVIVHTIKLFSEIISVEKIVVAVSVDWKNHFEELIKKHSLSEKIEVIEGGDRRFQSVKNALAVLPDEGLVSVHDAARPLASKSLIEKCFSVAEEKGSAVAAIELKDSLYAFENGEAKNVSRNNFRLVQTPQCFKLSEIKKAFTQTFSEKFTDDASVYEAAAYKVNLVEGETTNIKITTPEDLLFAEAMMKSK